MKIIINKLMYVITFILSKVIKRDKKKLVFGAWFGDKYTDNSKYLVRYLFNKHRDEFDITWVTRNQTVFDLIKSEFNSDIRVVMAGSLSAYYHQFNAKFFFTTTGRADVDYCMLGGATHIELWHGIPLKKINYDTYSDRKKIICRISDFLHKKNYFVVTPELDPNSELSLVYSSAFDVPKSKLLSTGQPRTDVFFDDTLEYQTPPSILNESYILYMPTHRLEGKKKFHFDELLDLKYIDEFCRVNGFKFLIKKHFYHGEDNLELSEFENIIDVTDMEIDPLILLKYSSALITDYSSCFIDYLLTGKKIIYYCYDLDDYVSNERGLYREFSSAISSAPVFDKDMLNRELELFVVSYHDEETIEACMYYHNSRPKFEDYHSSSEKIVNTILS